MGFLDYASLDENVLYTTNSMQYLCGTTGYFYIIKIMDPNAHEYYMNIREGTMENNIYEYLESLRTIFLHKRFTFRKMPIRISDNVTAPFIIITGVNEVVNLN